MTRHNCLEWNFLKLDKKFDTVRGKLRSGFVKIFIEINNKKTKYLVDRVGILDL